MLPLIEGPLIESLSRVFKVLGDANRLGIVLAIGRDARSVTEIIDATGLPQTLVSFHLKVLRETDVVNAERNGPFVYYSLKDAALLNIIAELLKKITLNGGASGE